MEPNKIKTEEARIFWIFLIPLMIQVPLLIISGHTNPDQMNPDLVSYLRVAQYYMHGNFHLAVNGYWGPLFSWLIVPVLPLVNDPLSGARIVNGISAVIYLIGGIRVLRAFEFDRITVVAGGILIALFSIYWSTFIIEPDLLMSGLLLIALSYTLASETGGTGRQPGLLKNSGTSMSAICNAGVSPAELEERGRPEASATKRKLRIFQQPRPFVAGLFYGAACLTKAVALPIALLALGGIALLRVLTGITSIRAAASMVGRSTMGMILMVLPWVMVLSLHYGKPTFSTSGILNHALVGPHNPNRLHPTFADYHIPEAGRITTWEDPTLFRDHPLYKLWSPLSSSVNFNHQAKLILYNARLQHYYLNQFDGTGIGVVSAILAFLFFRPWGRSFQTHPWRFSVIAIASITAIYLPVYALAPRYYLGCYPFLLSATFGLPTVLATAIQTRFGTRASVSQPSWIRNLAVILTALLFGYGLSGPLRQSLTGGNDEPSYVIAKQIARSLPFHGPIAAVGDKNRVALYIALLTEQPYYGIKVEKKVSVADLQKTGAVFVVVQRGLPVDQALSNDPATRLVALETQDYKTWPVRVYCLRPAQK